MPRSGIFFAVHFPPGNAKCSSCSSPIEQAPPPRQKNLYQTCPSQSVQVSPNFVQLVLVLHHFCPNAQLFPPPFRATLERKLNYETTHAIVHPEQLPGAGSNGTPPHSAARHNFKHHKLSKKSTGRLARLTLHESTLPSHESQRANHAPPITSRSTAAIFTRPNDSTRKLRMFLINGSAIRNVRNSLKTNNGDHF
jgi:hypothetical protein